MSNDDLRQFDVRVSVALSLDEIAEMVDESVGDHNDMVALIMRLDEITADWEATLALADYFAEQKRLYDEEVRDEQ